MRVLLRTRNLLCVVAAISLYCSDAPDLIFPEPGNNAVISGRILPALASTRVYLLRAGGPDTAVVDTLTEMFEFRDVPYGTYYLHATTPGYGTVEKVVVADKPVVGISDIKLTIVPRLIYSVAPDDGTVIDSAFICTRSSLVTATDIIVRIYFRETMDTASVRRALHVSPPMTGVGCSWKSGPNNFEVAIARNELDGDDTLVITVDTAAADRFGHHLEKNFVVSYPVDSGLGSVVPPPLLLSSITPLPDTRGVAPAAAMVLVFDSLMHEASVENAFSIKPAAIARYQWAYSNNKHLLNVTFAYGLKCGTWYTATLAAGWMTADSSMMGSTYSIKFETQRPAISYITPRNGETNVNPTTPLNFTTNFLADKTDFLRALTITPSVDSLSCTAEPGKVSVSHAPFDSGRTYVVTVDSSLRVPDSGTIGRMTIFTFTTVPKSDTVNPGDTVVWTPLPAHGKTDVAINQQFSCTFHQKIDSVAIESLIVIQPPVSYYCAWTFGNRLEIRPMHYLRSSTTYAITIDSGYQLRDSLIGKQVRWSFTTQPLQCIAHSPPYGMINANRSAPLVLAFSAPVDIGTLVDAVSISPAVSGLVVDSVANETPLSGSVRWSYWLSHDTLLADTTYTVTVDTSVTDQFGIASRSGAVFTFSTDD